MTESSWLDRPPDLRLARKLNALIVIISIAVLGTVASMRSIRLELPPGWSTAFLPNVYSLINVGVALLLVAALWFIRRGQVRAHRAAIQTALAGSALFLLMYVVYHITSEHRAFSGTGAIRVVYLVLLASHVILAAVSFPFILYTWALATTRQFERHRKMARLVFPVWLYVAVTGPLCWLMLALQ